MNSMNTEIIRQVEEIVQPYFEFNDYYRDANVVGYRYIEIEDMPRLFFKLKSIRPPLGGKRKQQEFVDKLNSLNIGTVTIETIPYFGRYIIIEVKKESG